jgi:hypothetical protein
VLAAQPTPRRRRSAGGRRSEHRPCQRPGACAGLDDDEVRRVAQALALGLDEPGDDGTEQRPDLGRGQEIAAAAGDPTRSVEAVRPVEGEIEVAIEPQRTAAGDGIDDVVSGRRHR